jgi:methylated-DNA-[protein]-cysteine S-methyltransferase
VVTSLVIVPDRRARAAYRPLHDLEESDVFDELFGQLAEYFAGARRKVELDFDLGPSGVTGFARRVLRETAKIGYGKTRTYSSIAEAAGRPDAYRQVLSILHENPIPILIPCHRVVTHKSGAGSFIAGEKKKRWLLDLERRSLDALEE